MNRFVTDTMAYILFLEKRKMPEVAKRIFKDAENGEIEILIPSMVITEIAYLSEKNRIDIKLEDVQNHLIENKTFKESPLDFAIIKTSFGIDDIPELHDRLIAGSAKYFNCELIPNDPIIENSKHLKTIWKK